MKKVENVQPQVGDKILVKHGSDGEGNTTKPRQKVEVIDAVYIGGKVRVGYSDVYEVRPSKSNEAKWETFVQRSTK